MDHKTVKEILFDKNDYYERITRNLRWASIVFTALTFPPGSQFAWVIYGALGLAAFYNLARYSRKLLNIKLIGSFISMNVADNAFVFILLIVSGGLASPYYPIVLLMVITATYWYGYKGLLVIGAYNIALGYYFLVHHNHLEFNQAYWSQLAVLVFLVGSFGYLIERLTNAERKERVSTQEANIEIQEEKQRLEALLNSLGNGVLAVTSKGKITTYNGAALELLDTNKDLHGLNIEQVAEVHDKEDDSIRLIDVAHSTHGKLHRDDLLLQSPDGSMMNLDMTVSPVVEQNSSKEHGYIFVLRDITKEKSLEQAKDEFVSVTSHELRTPIAISEASVSTVQAILDKNTDEKIHKMLNTAHENIVFLGKLVADLSTLARAERGILDVDLSKVDPKELLDQLSDDYKDEAKSKGLKLNVKTDDSLTPILSSSSHIKEILQNFITNALKYTKEGSVTLNASKSEKYKNGVAFSVSDTGIGVSASDKKQLFEKFFRSEDYRTRETGGTGLGLYIARRLAERLSGEITFDSTLNKGSVFTLDIPPVSQKKEDRPKVVEAQVDDFVSNL